MTELRAKMKTSCEKKVYEKALKIKTGLLLLLIIAPREISTSLLLTESISRRF